MKIGRRDEWEVTGSEIKSFALVCLQILMEAFKFFANNGWRLLKWCVELAIAAGIIYGLWKLGCWLFLVVFGW